MNKIIYASPNHIDIIYDNQPIKASYHNPDNINYDYKVIPIPFFRHENNIYFGKPGQIHGDMLKDLKINITQEFRKCEEYTQQGRLFIINNNDKVFITLWKKDLCKELIEDIKNNFELDKYILLYDNKIQEI